MIWSLMNRMEEIEGSEFEDGEERCERINDVLMVVAVRQNLGTFSKLRSSIMIRQALFRVFSGVTTRKTNAFRAYLALFTFRVES